MGLGLAAALPLAACGTEDDRARRTVPTAASAGVPAGVATQHRTLETEIRAEGGAKTVGPWRIAYIVEEAEGWFERRGDRYEWRSPAAGETHHLEIVPIEAATGRIVSGAPVTLEVRSAQGRLIERQPLRSYYGEFFHNAANFSLPGPGRYTLRATVEAPPLLRHGERDQSPPLAHSATIEFPDVAIGRGASDAEVTRRASQAKR